MDLMKLKLKDTNKESWLKRIIKVEKEFKQSKSGYCNDYSTKACLRCGRCWNNSSK
ncbi:hypothetical protein [Clostridium coskatii]|uniref:Uncharacterized protein n=1 Tax=Clostridium coskatii TaxID=1705578 RepID=A0A166TAC9_9CLOT|nr:hypothetical protein [Clostridium coskatii]OAA93434.1 hypothetical protein WX73_04184 [Clostridium coskatii]OBR96223.1 hypothetical protein CLCOS_09210 [Clostridium coskatii]